MKDLVITKLSDKGVGIAYDNGDEFYVKNALIGEKVSVHELDYFAKGSKRRDCTLETIHTRSHIRCEPLCDNFNVCGSCHLQHMTLKGQHQIKFDDIKASAKLLGIDDKVCSHILFNKDAKNLRNKTIRKFFKDKNGQIICGFYKTHSHSVVDIKKCPLEPSWFDAICSSFCTLFEDNNISIYDEISECGCVRSIMLRDVGKRLLMLYVAYDLSLDIKDKIKALCTNFNVDVIAISTIAYNTNSLNKGTIEYLTKNTCVRTKIMDLSFNVFVNTFLQVNSDSMALMYDEAIAYVKKSCNRDLVLDLCCGVGTMTLSLAKHFKKVIGVEIVKSSIDAAIENAKANNIDNVSFILDDINSFMPKFKDKKVNAIIADPARVGLGSSAKAIASLQGPLYVVLIFCSLKAFSRDVKVFLDNGFVVDKILGVDMFLHTRHVETMIFLKKE